jgi:hypothetical protein
MKPQHANNSSVQDPLLLLGVGVSPTSVLPQFCDIGTPEKLVPCRRSGDDSGGNSSSTNSRRSKYCRAVHFELDHKDTIQASIIESEIALTEEDRQKSWWSQREVGDISEKARKVILHYRKNREDYQVDFRHLFAECSRSSQLLNEYSSDSGCEQRGGGGRSARGLERHIHEILRQHRKNFIRTLLHIQSKMPSDMSLALRSKLLCAKSIHLSRPARNLAAAFARQDAVDVAELLQDELSTRSYYDASSLRSTRSQTVAYIFSGGQRSENLILHL